ncbi:PLB3 Lysophospholipase 3 [Candida maltosa Xu316]|uniref:Lysophospholipase n=1 Tax=Candida maltosa (strain Xu316) TaxID=1245528 RepID=M3K3F4_CANMX|nr:Lysophospholipase 1 [Candida maltosa Xu316]
MEVIKLSLLLFSLASSVLAWSPTDSYAPGEIQCPSNSSLTRDADSLSSEEQRWLEGRSSVTDANLITFLQHANMTDFDPESYINGLDRTIRIGLAFSGGGYRAMLNGAGQLSALDNRTRGAWEHGLGGLLESSTYLVGLSGGNWLVGTIAMNNYTSVQKILDDGKLWDLSHSFVNPGGWNIKKTYDFYKGISDALDDKRNAGYDVSLTDTWGRALSYSFFSELNDTGAALTWSTLQDVDVFQNYEMPFPIVVADGRTPGTFIINDNSTIFEFNPFEMGSWDPSVYQFTQVKYLGTEVNDGKPVNGKCVGGYDNAGFVMGTSSSLFNQFILQINTTSLSSAIKSILTSILQDVSSDENDIAVYKPNPFQHNDVGTSQSISVNDTLYLCDGGEDLQNVPLYPLLQKERQVDVVFAFDNSADTNQYWPNGASIVASYQRQFGNQSNGTSFPYVPDITTFVNLNLTSKPTFFGCDARNLSSLTNNLTSVYDIPLLVYTANRPFTYWSNTSTFKLSYENDERDSIIQNGFEVASRLNGTIDPEWNACVGCAIIRRSQERTNADQSDQCKQCFERYCWDGTLSRDSSINVNFTTEGSTNGTETLKINSGSILGISSSVLAVVLAAVSAFVLG